MITPVGGLPLTMLPSFATHLRYPAMAQSSGQTDAMTCSKCCKTLESSKRYDRTDGQPARIAERTTSVAAHAVLSRSWHASAAAPSSLQDKVASRNPRMATSWIGLGFPEYVDCLVISASSAAFFLGSTWTTNEEPRNRQGVSATCQCLLRERIFYPVSGD